MSHKKLTKQQLQENYRNLFEVADELLLDHMDGHFAPNFEPLIELLEELSGSNFYKRWGQPEPKTFTIKELEDETGLKVHHSERVGSN
tara:strand:- start:135 stop:398 length:264 start_codon:yes stop_codon:yes gene_type:complete